MHSIGFKVKLLFLIILNMVASLSYKPILAVICQGDNEFEAVDNCITSVLGRHVELTEEFTRCYEAWLQREVLDTTIHWDLLLSTNTNTSTTCLNCSSAADSRDKTRTLAPVGGEDSKCTCKGRLVTNTEYTPLIQQLSGQHYTPNLLEDQEDDAEYDKKDRMLTMIKKPSTNSPGATNGAVVDIPLDDDEQNPPSEAEKIDNVE